MFFIEHFTLLKFGKDNIIKGLFLAKYFFSMKFGWDSLSLGIFLDSKSNDFYARDIRRDLSRCWEDVINTNGEYLFDKIYLVCDKIKF